MKSIWQAIVLVFLVTLALAILGCSLFIGVGALLALWLPLTLFQAASLAIGAALTIAVIVFALSSIVSFIADHPPYDGDLSDWDPFDEDDDPLPFPEPPTPKIGRNAPCPCGSGKKYKNCCGKSPAP